MAAGLTFVDNISKDLKAKISRANTVSSYLDRVFARQFAKAQIERWETQNASETGQWQALNTKYATYKKKKFASFPGGGSKMMIATGKLQGAATLRDSAGYLKLTTNKSISISINTGYIPYAIYPGTMRPFMEFSDETERKWSDAITDFIGLGKEVSA